jgi:hypothetical protein
MYTGGFAQVFEGSYLGQPVAVKCLKGNGMAVDECNAMLRATHPNIVRIRVRAPARSHPALPPLRRPCMTLRSRCTSRVRLRLRVWVRFRVWVRVRVSVRVRVRVTPWLERPSNDYPLYSGISVGHPDAIQTPS